jgi:hypothetical protein
MRVFAIVELVNVNALKVTLVKLVNEKVAGMTVQVMVAVFPSNRPRVCLLRIQWAK